MPELPRMTQTWRKTLSGHFQVLIVITEWGDGELPAVGLGQNQVHHINQRINSILSYPPANTYMQLWICERKKKRKLLLYYSNNA